MRVLAIDPFHTGSHRDFLEGVMRHSRHQWQVITGPGVHWKWRMRSFPIVVADQIRRGRLAESIDAVFCTDMLDLPAMLGMVRRDAVARLPVLAYFHENQWAYPVRPGVRPDHHYGYTNLLTALAADRVVFNSRHNRDTFLAGSREFLRRMPDSVDAHRLESVEASAVVISPGYEPWGKSPVPAETESPVPAEAAQTGTEIIPAESLAGCRVPAGGVPAGDGHPSPDRRGDTDHRGDTALDPGDSDPGDRAIGALAGPSVGQGRAEVVDQRSLRRPRSGAAGLTLGWVSRWESDKRPDRFLELLSSLRESKIEFRLVLLGPRPRVMPESHREITARFSGQIDFDGFAPTRDEYRRQLDSIDVVVSAADHEFFGIAMCEAIDAGAVPLVPEGLGYDEYTPPQCRYRDVSGAIEILRAWADDRTRHRLASQCRKRIQPFRRSAEVARLDEVIDGMVGGHGVGQGGE